MNTLKVLFPAMCITALSCVVSAPSVADGLYIGAGVYRADTDAGDDTTPGGVLGYTFVDSNVLMLSLEAGYYDLGDTGNRNLSLDAEAFTAGGVVALPLGPFLEIYAKGGVAFLDAEARGFGLRDSENDEKAYYGAGASIDILDTIDIYAEYIAFDTNYDANVAGVGIKISF